MAVPPHTRSGEREQPLISHPRRSRQAVRSTYKLGLPDRELTRGRAWGAAWCGTDSATL